MRVLGGSPLHGSDALGFADGDCPWNLSLGALVMGNLMGRHFWVGCGCFFLEGWGRGRGTPGYDCRDVFAGRREFQTALFLCYILYVEQWRFRCTCLQAIAKGVLDPRGPGQRTCAVQASSTRRPVPHIETVKGLCHLVPSRTPRISGYGVLCTCGLCYMLFLLYV